MIWEPKKIKSLTVSIVSLSICHATKGHEILKEITQIHSQLWHHAPVSVSFCRVLGIGGEVALERFPAFVVVLIQTIRGLQPPLGDGHI